MYSYLLVGDIHIRLDNFDEVDLLLDQICTYLRSTKGTQLVLLGDLLHTFEKINSTCMNKACDFIKKCSEITKTYVLVGNHDYINQHQFQTEQHWMNPLKYWGNQVVIVDKATLVDTGVIMCPYVPNGRLFEALSTTTLGNNWMNVDLVLGHQEIKSCKMGTFLSESGDVWEPTYPPFISGHIHETQQLGDNVYYPGAPLQHGSGDYQKDRIMCLVEGGSGNKLKKTEILLRVPRKQTLKICMDELPRVLKEIRPEDKIKLVLTDLGTEQFKLFKETREYSDLVKRDIQVHAQKKVPSVVKEEKQQVKCSSFKDILRGMADKANVIEVYKQYL